MTVIDELSDLIAVYGAELNERQIDFYLEALADVDPKYLHLGIIRLVKTSKWMPKISEIRQAAQDEQIVFESEGAMIWHEQRNAATASPWLKVNLYERRSANRIPVLIEWQTCPTCQVKFANWEVCPDCGGFTP